MREIIFEYGFHSINGIVKKQYHLNEVPYIREKCDVWNKLPVAFIRQFTGLTDKNGTKIFEGDVVRILYTDWASKPNNDPRTLEQYLIDISKIGVVEFNDNAWEIKFWSDKYKEYYHSTIKHGIHGRIDVIGNIHDNPELLK